MSQACQDAKEPVGAKIARMKQSIARLEALERFFPDLLIKQDPMKDIYQSKEIWKHVEDIEILQGSNVIKVLPYKDIHVTFHDYDKTYESTYRIYTNPMEISLVGYYEDFENSKGLKDYITNIQIQNYMGRLEGLPYKESLLKKIEYQLYAYLKRTVLEAPNRYRILNEEYLPEKLQTLITFA